MARRFRTQPEYARDYQEFPSFGEGLVPIRIEHGPAVITHDGHITMDVGRVIKFRP